MVILINPKNGHEALGVTISSIWKHGSSSSIFFARNAFTSREQFAVVMAHELGHVVYANLGAKMMSEVDQIPGNPTRLLDSEGHIAIQKMTGDLILKNGWKPSLIQGQEWRFNGNQPYPHLLGPIQSLIRTIKFRR